MSSNIRIDANLPAGRLINAFFVVLYIILIEIYLLVGT